MSPWFSFLDWPLRAKMVALLIAASLLPLTIAAVIDVRDARHTLITKTSAILAARGDQLVGELDTFHRGYQLSARRFSRLPAIVRFCRAPPAEADSLRAAARAVLQAQPDSDPSVRGAGLLDLAGNVTVATDVALVGKSLAFHAYVREALRGVPVISDIHLAEPEVGRAPTIAYVVPVLGLDQKPIALLALWVNATSLWDIARSSNHLAGPGSFAVLFDREGVRIAHTYSREIVFHPGGALDSKVLEEFVAEERFGTSTRQLLMAVRPFREQFERARAQSPNRDMFRGFAPVNQTWNYGVGRRFKTTQWTVFYMIPEASLNAEISGMTRHKMLFATAIILAALATGLLFARVILQPVLSLATATGLLASGALGARVRSKRHDEIGQLGSSFDRMAERIEVQAKALQQTNEELEARVQERTAELARKAQALRESEESLATTLNSIGDAVIATDTDGRVTRMNPVAEQLTGWPQAEAQGKALTDVFRIMNEGTNAPVASPVERVLRDGVVVGLANHTVLVARNGVKRPIADSGAPIRDAHGALRGVVLVFRDQTEERRVEQALLDSHARKGAILEAALDCIVSMDHTGAITEFNPAAENTFGYSRAAAIGQPLVDLIIPPSLRERHSAGLRRYLDTGVGPVLGKRIELRALRRDGSEIPVELAVVRTRSEGPPTFTAYIRDLTERRQAAGALKTESAHRERAEEALRQTEEQLRQSQKMEAIGTLAGSIAHDFNNLLSIILGYGEMLVEGLESADPMREDLEEIAQAAERAKDLTQQLLAFSRQQVLEPKILNLNDAIAGMTKMLRRIIGEDLELALLPASHLGTVFVDPGQIGQVLLNLVVNARDAMPRGGKLTIETADVELDSTYASDHPEVEAGRYVMLSVSDTGVGMDRATQARIFEPFYTTKERGKGTGLGLSTVFGIVKQSGGSIWVYSEPGEGTTFKIYLPRSDVHATAVERSTPSPTTRRGSETILLVEDDEQVRNLAITILRRHGYQVLDAATGGEALLICEQHQGTIHALLTDVIMPRMSGRELWQRVAPLRPAMKVLFMSGYTDDAIVHHGVLSSELAFVQKPLMPGALLLKLRAVLDGPGKN